MPPPRVNKIPRNEDSAKDKKGTLDIPLKFLDQDYQELKKNCIIKRERYVDDKFPSDSSSIDTNNELGLDMGQIKWLRPSKIVADPQLIVKGVSRFDYAQGSYLGDCWFLASVGALTFREDVMNQVMPADQSFGEEYAGIFHFRFWRFGKWIDVVIDDKLPTINGKLIFVHSKTSNEFWPALLEKAYAKVCGSYADMHAGLVSEALLDFTGGIHVRFEPAKASIDLWSLMDRAAKAKALMACGTFQGRTSENTVLPNGIVQGHAYSVTGVFKVTCKEKPVRLVRVLNPWGKGEWTGSWSDNSLLWNKVSEKEQSKCRSLVNDGEFWMSMEDFSKYFEDIDICCLSPDFLDSSSKCSWTSTCYNDSWVAGTTAGGCLNNKDSNMVLAQIQAISGTCEFNVYQMWAESGPTLCCCLDSFWKNPQFRVRIEALDKECAANAQCPENILVSLMQNQEKRHRSDVSNYAIGFSVFAIPPEMKDKKLPDKFFNSKRPVADCGNFLITRHVMKFFKLEPGEYLIVPSTFNPNESAKFILSIFTKSESQKTNKKPQMTYV